MKDIKKRSNDKYLFGGNREAEIQRDGEKCVRCGTTRQEHFNKFNRDLNVDHIDGKGCPVPKAEKNNDLDNLQTLCHDCHRHKDSDKSPHKLTDMQVINIFHIGRA